MRIEFTQEGGLAYFPGLNQAVTIDVDRLDAGAAEELKRLVEAAHFFDLPSAIGAPARGAADYQHYVITVEESGRQHTVRILIPVENVPLPASYPGGPKAGQGCPGGGTRNSSQCDSRRAALMDPMPLAAYWVSGSNRAKTYGNAHYESWRLAYVFVNIRWTLTVSPGSSTLYK